METTEVVEHRTTNGTYNRPWTEKELQYLHDNYGLLPDEEICQHLNRSLDALHIASVRKLRINHKSNLYTARSVSLILGVSCSKTIIAWMKRGWLKGERSSVRCGGGLMWNFSYENIEAFVRSRPWLFKLSQMEESFFRSVVKEEFERSPWYSLRQACDMVGVSYYSAAMSLYIKRKWLHPIKKPIEGGNHWTWVFLKSDIGNFLANDPRRDTASQGVITRRKNRLRAGRPVQICTVWKMKCPVCGKMVRIAADTHAKSPAIKTRFLEQFCPDGVCRHKHLNRLAKQLKPYHIRPRKTIHREGGYSANRKMDTRTA